MSIRQIKERAIKVKNINTNNGWGFGGKMGREYILPENRVCFVGQFCYRHSKPTRITQYYIEGKQVSEGEFVKNLT